MTDERIASPHAGLQVILSHLRGLSPHSRRAPSYSERNAAEKIIAVAAQQTGEEVNVTPIWRINHASLVDSEVVAWSVTNRLN